MINVLRLNLQVKRKRTFKKPYNSSCYYNLFWFLSMNKWLGFPVIKKNWFSVSGPAVYVIISIIIDSL
jgi:hypothetical protein